jgi:hypothetical protein
MRESSVWVPRPKLQLAASRGLALKPQRKLTRHRPCREVRDHRVWNCSGCAGRAGRRASSAASSCWQPGRSREVQSLSGSPCQDPAALERLRNFTMPPATVTYAAFRAELRSWMRFTPPTRWGRDGLNAAAMCLGGSRQSARLWCWGLHSDSIGCRVAGFAERRSSRRPASCSPSAAELRLIAGDFYRCGSTPYQFQGNYSNATETTSLENRADSTQVPMGERRIVSAFGRTPPRGATIEQARRGLDETIHVIFNQRHGRAREPECRTMPAAAALTTSIEPVARTAYSSVDTHTGVTFTRHSQIGRITPTMKRGTRVSTTSPEWAPTIMQIRCRCQIPVSAAARTYAPGSYCDARAIFSPATASAAAVRHSNHTQQQISPIATSGKTRQLRAQNLR